MRCAGVLFMPHTHATASRPLRVPAADIAGEDDFWGNLTSYARFFVTVMLGTVNVVSQPFRKVRRTRQCAPSLMHDRA